MFSVIDYGVFWNEIPLCFWDKIRKHWPKIYIAADKSPYSHFFLLCHKNMETL